MAKSQDQLRIRAAWLYYIEGMTQSDVGKKLGVNRITVTRLLSDAKKRGEVVIRIKSELTELVDLQQQLQEVFGLDQAILAPLESPEDDPTRVIAAAAGTYVSEVMENGMTVGVGWGKTLHAMLPYIEDKPLSDVRVVSLLGSIAQARRFNPAEFAWQFAELFEAEGYLVSAPAVVDSPQTKHALLENCGLDQILQLGEACDIALLSCGGITSLTTSYRSGHITESDRQSLIAAGAVGDFLYHFLDKDGTVVDHPVNARSISLSLDRLKRIPRKILISGGREKIEILRASISSLAPNVLITDEITARTLLETADATTDRSVAKPV
ncbi:sugar-binding transcriptional regulator [Marivita sp. XM-24bin2]|jgi:DNA-binding transcriptional regulator LsrR (DeoR family)|uniref:sugar-binding transcriptional regulator n=1 Tax=unclassified Marivita TaxID=2632480 RepID=UPI000D79F806|nr:sugar-binding transcriptional regulator [Marivita sp. XM-24bin2]MCR9109812.1 sugar-binding transcriptional regulator [Paracoccaceae bacterium]PWL33267.1 MAG: LacI family transcriptional regulator [Marivita sp. XM-24bin2]